MPFPLIPLLSIAVPAVAGMAGNVANAIGQNKGIAANNQAQIDLEKLRNEHNLGLWQKQNAYNTPAAQMQRFKEAGLNPNLIYGQGNPGNAVAINPADRPNTQPVNKAAGMAAVLGGVANVQNVMMNQATFDNLKTQNQVMMQEARKRMYEANIMENKSVMSEFEKDYVIDTFDSRKSKQFYDTMGSLHSYYKKETEGDLLLDERVWREQNPQALADYWEAKYKTPGESLEGLRLANALKEWDIDIREIQANLAQYGIMPGTDIYSTVLNTITKLITSRKPNEKQKQVINQRRRK